MTTGGSHALRSIDSEREDAVPTRPGLLTNAFLQRILAAASHTTVSINDDDGGNNDDNNATVPPAFVVTGFEWKPLEVGVISEVVAVTAFVRERGADSSATEATERHLVAKFLRPEFPFESMFQVESTFYSNFHGASANASPSSRADSLPFAIPTPIFTSSVLIVLERVPTVETFTCVEGCPTDRIAQLVAKLAQMHARLWDRDCDGLAVPAGIGSNLGGAAKREQFPGLWRAYLDDIPLKQDDRARLDALCEHLSTNTALLETTHELVDLGPQTLIHGDYHVANILFPATSASSSTNESDGEDHVWLLDWATCGRGNPMRDLAFFFIVSVSERDRRAHEARSLQLYHETVSRERADAVPCESSTPLSVADWTREYQVCVLNQFLILVVYDHLSKHLAANAKTAKLRSELDTHFRAVNLRACLSVLDNVRDCAHLVALLAT